MIDLASLRRQLIATKGNRAPGAVIVEGSVFVNGVLPGYDPDYVATFASDDAARAALIAAGWVPYGNSTIAFFPEKRVAALKEPKPRDASCNHWNQGEVCDWAAAL